MRRQSVCERGTSNDLPKSMIRIAACQVILYKFIVFLEIIVYRRLAARILALEPCGTFRHRHPTALWRSAKRRVASSAASFRSELPNSSSGLLGARRVMPHAQHLMHAI